MSATYTRPNRVDDTVSTRLSGSLSERIRTETTRVASASSGCDGIPRRASVHGERVSSPPKSMPSPLNGAWPAASMSL